MIINPFLKMEKKTKRNLDISKDKYLQEQVINSGIVKAIGAIDLANYPEAQKPLAEFLEVIGLQPETIVKHYKNKQTVKELNNSVDFIHEATINLINK